MKILFQGDSITDAGRNRNDEKGLAGYSLYVSEQLGKEHEYVNKGISGNRVADLLRRYDEDFLKIKPDLITVMIGINDVWRKYDSNLYESAEEFKAYYVELLDKIKKDLPKTKIILIEPYLLPIPTKKHWRQDLIQLIDVVRELAKDYADGFIPLDGLFAKECFYRDWQEFSTDGVHPIVEGQKVIAKYVSEEIKRVIK